MFSESLKQLNENQTQIVNSCFEKKGNFLFLGFKEKNYGLHMKLDDIKGLQNDKWLCDEIINGYMNLLKSDHNNAYIFNTIFYYELTCSGLSKVERYIHSKLNNINIFKGKDYILFPIHLPNHWVLLVVFLKLEKIVYYDSLGFNVLIY